MLLTPHHGEVSSQEREDQHRDQHHVEGIEATDDSVAGPFAAEDRKSESLTDDRDREKDPVHDSEPCARQEVVRKRVAGEPGAERQQ